MANEMITEKQTTKAAVGHEQQTRTDTPKKPSITIDIESARKLLDLL